MPKSNYITGVTSALLYFKATARGKSEEDNLSDFEPFLRNIWVFSSKCPGVPLEENSSS